MSVRTLRAPAGARQPHVAPRLTQRGRCAPPQRAPCAAERSRRLPCGASLAEQNSEFQELRAACEASDGDVVLDEGPYGRGLFLPKGAACAEVVLRVPLRWAMIVRGDLDAVDPDAILASRVYQLHEQWEAANGVTLPDSLRLLIDSAFPAEQRLAFWLLFAVRFGGPVWRRLGALLPGPDVCPSPLLWPDAELRELQDTAFAMQCSAGRQTASRGFEGFLEGWPLGPQLHAALGHPTAEQFVWALSMVQSRGMADQLPGVGGAPGERVACLIPFCDMANHFAGDPGFSGAVDDAGEAFAFTCCRVDGVPRGAELTVSYRDSASNLESMRKYGFVTPHNPNDWFMLSGGKSPADVRAMAVDRARLEPLARAALKGDALAYLPAALASLPVQPPEEGQLSSLAEQASRAAALHGALAEELALFPTSLEQDEALLTAGGLGVRLDAAVRFRRERKRLIKAAQDAVGLYAAATARVAAKAAA